MKVLEHIIEKLETEQKSCEAKHAWDYAKGLEYAIGIIKQETAEYQDFDMEFAKKCVELSEKMNVCDLVADRSGGW